MRKFLLILALFIGMAVCALWLTPWNTVLEGQIRKVLVARGFTDVSLEVAGFGLHGVELKDLHLGRDAPLRFSNVNVSYTLAGLRQYKLNELTLIGPSFRLLQGERGWVIEGAEAFFQADENVKPRTVESLTALLQVLPFEAIAVTEGRLIVAGEDMAAEMPLNGRYRKSEGRIEYQADQASFRKGTINALLHDLEATMTWDAEKRSWQGNWQAGKIETSGAAAEVPALKAKGTIEAIGTVLKLAGQLYSDNRQYLINFIYEYPLEQDKTALLTINNAAMPWKEGRLKLGQVKWPLDGKARDMKLNVQAENISVDALLGALTGQRVQATGNISGTVPVTLKANGDLVFHHGNLKTAAPGKIIMPPDAIPGDNEQVKLVRNILADLNYTNLSINMDSEGGNDLGILMTVEGNNPGVYNGRAVKLNVNLTGDVLDFIRQNVMLLTNPEALWEQDHVKSAKP